MNASPQLVDRIRMMAYDYSVTEPGPIAPIDWVESIPFQETRQYVQKVMQNLHVYRSRLAPKTVRPMTADLMRGARTDRPSGPTTKPMVRRLPRAKA